jgi:DNA adenine methylase
LEDHVRLVGHLKELKGHAVLSGYIHPVYQPLEALGWRRVDFDVIASTSNHRAKRIESLWLSASCERPIQHGAVIVTLQDQTKRQAAAYRTHVIRVGQSELQIKEAIFSLKRTKKTVTKMEVSRMTGISRVHLSRGYAHMFL